MSTGHDSVYVHTQPAWTRALADGPAAVLCHVHAFGEQGRGFELVWSARGEGLDVPIAFYTPRLTPNDERTARELGAAVTDDLSFAVARLMTALAAAGPGA